MSFEKRLSSLFEDEEGVEGTSTEAFESIEEQQANDTLTGDCSEFEKQQQIFNLIPRNELDTEADFFIYDPLKANRPYNKLYHIMFMNKSEPWGEFPKRKNAVVAYANKDKITEEGVTYIAIPFNKTKLGVAPKEKIDECFNNVSINLGMKFEYFNRAFNILLNVFNNPEGTYEKDTKKLTLSGEKFYDHSYSELQQAIKTADMAIAENDGQAIMSAVTENPFNKETEANVISIIEYLKAKRITIQDMVDKLFAPNENGFKFIAFKDFIVGENKDNEVWFNNKCLLVKETAFDRLRFAGGEEESATDEFATDEPTDEEPTDEEPTDEEPATDELATDEPADEEPADEEPADEEPADEEPADEEPAEDELFSDEEDEDVKKESYSYSSKPFLDLIENK